jgi:phosphoribosyl 1,2-cyclic phosphate phosphodiesterase
MQLTILGSGSSAGTPAIGCNCATCTSANPRNRRTRCSSLITLSSGHNILIDTSPDLRAQALREGVRHVDAVLYTHTHADHLNGIDDLRAFCVLQRKQIPLFSYSEAIEQIEARFGYAIREPNGFWEMPVLSTQAVDSDFELFDVKVYPVPVMHGRAAIYGYRIGNLAYLTDVSQIPESSFGLLEGLDVLLIDCLRNAAHPTHINIEQSLNYIKEINAQQSVLIHMTHELEYESLMQSLPDNVVVGYDGLKLELN